jgi:uncharacterized membrane protein
LSLLSDAKTLGGIGSILVLLTVAPNIGWIFGIAGFVMILVAISKISQAVNDKKIYDNMLKSVILAIGAIVVGTVTVIGSVYKVMGMGSFVGSDFVLSPNITTGDWIGLAVAAAGGLIAVWAILVASAVFIRRSFNSMASKLNVKMFETAALIYLIGAATAIVGIGFLLLFVAEILLIVSFFSIQEQQQRVPQEAQAQVIPPSP